MLHLDKVSFLVDLLASSCLKKKNRPTNFWVNSCDPFLSHFFILFFSEKWPLIPNSIEVREVLRTHIQDFCFTTLESLHHHLHLITWCSIFLEDTQIISKMCLNCQRDCLLETILPFWLNSWQCSLVDLQESPLPWMRINPTHGLHQNALLLTRHRAHGITHLLQTNDFPDVPNSQKDLSEKLTMQDSYSVYPRTGWRISFCHLLDRNCFFDALLYIRIPFILRAEAFATASCQCYISTVLTATRLCRGDIYKKRWFWHFLGRPAIFFSTTKPFYFKILSHVFVVGPVW